ncbi:MAG: orotate phosphoribosyltransferase, partial [Syntrophales bacterium LBB04]|nr:orotate phosphoribosyltransferase [Syntrophales bacterium LBB04]
YGYKERLFHLLAERAFFFGDFTLASGKKSDHYFDCRKITRSAEGLFLLGQVFYDLIQSIDPETNGVGGMTMGADPICDAVSLVSFMNENPIEAVIVRKEEKTHGMGKDLVGNIDKVTKLAVVDDVFTTGGSTLKAIDVFERYPNAKIVGAIALVNREEGATENLAARGIKASAGFTKSEILNFARSRSQKV